MNVRFLRPARRELRDAAEFYGNVRPQLRRAFLKQVRAGIEMVEQFPTAWTKLSPTIRRYQLKKFPYGLLYEIDDSTIIVIAVMHLSRHPDYWRNHLEE